MPNTSPERAVRERYASAAKQPEQALCCPVDYDPRYLAKIPREVIEKDYGCGDPSRYLREGETVLDLGSGTGKICFIASQVVGPTGNVVGIDMTDDMLEVARRNAPIVAAEIGHANVQFRKGRIQDLALDLEVLDRKLRENPIDGSDAYLAAEALAEELRIKQPMVESESVDVVVSNCVLNLVGSKQKAELFGEIFRVLRRGGRAVISDIVSDESVPSHLEADPELWSGCISGAMTEEGFLRAFEEAGFYGLRVLKYDMEPWRTVEGIEFRSMTLEAFKGKQGPCLERTQAVIYRGPFREVLDDDGHRIRRGERHAVCDKTFELYRKAPYAGCFEHVEPRIDVPMDEARAFDCSRTAKRHPRETKGGDYLATTEAAGCDSGGNCC